jgi:hypothetical protein
MPAWLQVGVGVYVVGAIGTSIWLAHGASEADVNFTVSPSASPAEAERQRREFQRGLRIVFLIMPIGMSIFWPIILGYRAWILLTDKDDEDEPPPPTVTPTP